MLSFSGLPGSGKTTIATELARRLGAAYLRIDTIERGLEELCSVKVRGEGYALARRIAADNLRLGLDVVADCVNPWELTRREWEAVARDCGAECLDIETVCSDVDEHRRRVESRVADIPGLRLPTWEEALEREYQAWEGERILVETSGRAAVDCVDELLAAVERRRAPKGSASGPQGALAGGETDLERLLWSMEPALSAEEYVFDLVVEADPRAAGAWATVREDEGLTLILEKRRAERLGLRSEPSFKRITLRVHSSLEAVGLTAAVSSALAREGVSANVVAAYCHDHVFVPSLRADEAVEILKRLSRRA